MAIDTAEKRRSVSGLPFFPLGPGVTPTVDKDQEWRQEAGWGYSGILVGEAVVVVTRTIADRTVTPRRVPVKPFTLPLTTLKVPRLAVLLPVALIVPPEEVVAPPVAPKPVVPVRLALPALKVSMAASLAPVMIGPAPHLPLETLVVHGWSKRQEQLDMLRTMEDYLLIGLPR